MVASTRMRSAARAADPTSLEVPLTRLLAALPLGACASLLAAEWLPIEFAYRPNELGIVSPATLALYPVQQETFWYVALVVIGLGVSAMVALVFCGRAPSPRRALAAEIASVATLVAALAVSPPWLRVACVVLGGALVLALACLGSPPLPDRPSLADTSSLPIGARESLPGWRWAAIFIVLSVALTHILLDAVVAVATGVPDLQLASQDWYFQAEDGQHLAWADVLQRGGFQGRDYFSLYGPYHETGLLLFWKVLGRSVAAWRLYLAVGIVAGLVATLWLAARLCRRPAFALLVPCVGTMAYARYGVGLFGIACLYSWLSTGRRRAVFVAGALAGFGLLFGQEFGLAFMLSTAIVLAIRTDFVGMALFSGGVGAATLPFLAWYAAYGALLPLLADLAGYPLYLMVGFGKIPFPSLVSALPLDLLGPPPPDEWLLRAGVAMAAVTAAACLLVLPREAFRRPSPRLVLRELRRSPRSLALLATAIYGALCFRVVLGRSDAGHLEAVMAVPAILIAVAADGIWAGWRERTTSGLATAWRAIALAAFCVQGALIAVAKPLESLAASYRVVLDPASRVGASPPDPEIEGVTRWLASQTTPEDTVWVLVNSAGYQYLIDRAGPTRWVLSHQMVTDAHRREAWEALQRSPPRRILYDQTTAGLDGVLDSTVLGPAITRWIEERWEVEARFEDAVVLRPRSPRALPCARPPLTPPRPLHLAEPGCPLDLGASIPGDG